MDSLVLGIESSCDETAVAVVKNGTQVLANEISSQMDLHARYGGVVPEVASRQHLESLPLLVQEAFQKSKVSFDDITGIAVTASPGLIGALLVGVSAAKALSFRLNLPLTTVHHIEAHLYATQLDAEPIAFPALGLVVSGGHTQLFHIENWGQYKLLASTRDDAAGEAYDKVAKLMGLGYPGGPMIEKLAKLSPDTKEMFTRVRMTDGTEDFSFSGLKSAVSREVQEHLVRTDKEQQKLAAKFQNTVLMELSSRVRNALGNAEFKSVIVGGGVACNQALRESLKRVTDSFGVVLRVPPAKYCSDNAAMIAGLGAYQLSLGKRADLSATAIPRATFY